MNPERDPPASDSLFGQFALRLGLLSQERLEKALETQRQSEAEKTLAEILLDEKVLTPDGVRRIRKAQKMLASQDLHRAKATREDGIFGKLAIYLNFCRETQMRECTAIQEQLPQDRFMRLGDIMVIKGYLSVHQVKRTIDVQKALIIYCRVCDTQFNVVMLLPGTTLLCHRCGASLRVPERKSSPQMDEKLYFGEEA